MVDIGRGNKSRRAGLLKAMICKSAKQRAALLRYESFRAVRLRSPAAASC